MTQLQQLDEACAYLEKFDFAPPKYAVVLGTGLGKLISHIEISCSIEYINIPHFAESTVEFHRGKLIFGTINGVPMVAMQGRFHLYEGYSQQQITFPIRVLKALGAEKLLLSNAAGGVNLAYKKGDLILINDHINLQGGSPIIGYNTMAYGGMFPDMSEPYSRLLSHSLQSHAAAQDLALKTGVYVAVTGPQLETRAEYRYLKIIGADVVGMSTVPEVIVANQIGLPCAVVSVITDECDPNNLKPVNIEEIIAVAGTADHKLSALFASVISGG